MKKVCSILIFLSFNNFIFAQSKKEIIANQKSKIAVLEDKIRTLDFELSESNSLIEEFVDYNTEIINESKSLNNALQKCNQNNTSLNDTINILIQELTTLKRLENELILTPELFLISELKSVMGFVIGQECPPEFKLGNFSITKEKKTSFSQFEYQNFVRDIYYVRLGEELLLEIQDNWEFDPLTDKYGPTGFINYITIFSDRFKTNNGIGVGSSLSECLAIGETISEGSLSAGFNLDSKEIPARILIDFGGFDRNSIEEPLKECWHADVYWGCSYAVEAFPDSTKISGIQYGYGDRNSKGGI